ncbi:EAL domain-containing protein [Dissulfurirhabdus thermomarina]|uniref:EAL domain-containing protein n=1 Tax=Dissulfurirhabdus thermomarina TaxID=1765737 RepID=A0A6N9TT28_DISTH|nr:EAL domain-containing protein [Dissulfurirhabdus thermomarina]NDY43550.1 EAL domain-containing protein [Dissulfurirhabdus thermomarina]NMX23451.1 EAL domain-containing protein [Dissulfurirhabdus thermomarina]
MTLQIISLVLTVVGTLLLGVSLPPIRSICEGDVYQCRRWKALGALVMAFMVGYVLFGVEVARSGAGPVELVVALVLCGGGIFVILVVRMSLASIRNIQRIAALERYRALHDDLTELPNRALLHERIQQAISLARRRGEAVAVLLLDLDRFKEINDALGHFYGDYILQLTASRLREAVRDSDTVSRLGGDEFAVVLIGAGVSEAAAVAEKIAKALAEPFMVEGHSLNVGASVGIALFPDHGDDAEILLQRADVAMYEAKRAGETLAVYRAEHDQYTWQRLTLIGELRQAIDKGRLDLHYQPKVDLATGRVRGVEALVRWPHEQKGLLYSDAFIPLAEQAGLIRPLTLWVFEHAVRQATAWRHEGLVLTVSVNLSVKDLQDVDFPRKVERIFHLEGGDPSRFMVELTEGSMMLNPERALQVISALHRIGLRLAIDDFGTGYSSFAYLKQLPASEIKIDKSFVRHMVEEENDAAIVRSTIDLAHNLDLRVVAEGVENVATLEALRRLRCDMVQGFVVSPPLPAAEIPGWMRRFSLGGTWDAREGTAAPPLGTGGGGG